MNGDQTDQAQPEIQDPPPAPMMGVAPPMILRGDPSIPRAASVPIRDPGFEERRLRYQIANLPLAQANEAVSAAMKYQGQRGFQADLQAGKTPQEALAKWAPMLFYSHPQVFSGALSRAFTPPPPQLAPPSIQTIDGQKFLAIPGAKGTKYQTVKEPGVKAPKVMNVDGKLIEVNPDGTTTQIYPVPKPGSKSSGSIVNSPFFRGMFGGPAGVASGAISAEAAQGSGATHRYDEKKKKIVLIGAADDEGPEPEDR